MSRASPLGNAGDPSNGDDDILTSAEHQAAVDDDPEEFLVGPHGNLLNQDQDGQPGQSLGSWTPMEMPSVAEAGPWL